MTVKTVYIADDGTEFETREECERYETSLKEFPPCIIALDENGERVEYPSEWNSVEYLIIKDGAKEALELMDSYYGAFRGDMTPGRWYYNWDSDEWEELDSLANKVAGMKEIFDRYENV